jgi:TolB-like protein/Flp pilus assembly protein TadD
MVMAVGALSWFISWDKPTRVERRSAPVSDKPSIAVLPFNNMGGDPDQEYFADGVTEDLTTDLSKVSGLFVIARNSAFAYKGKAINVEQVAEELGVRYILEGSVRRAGNQLRINAQLIDASTGGHVWAQRYDGTVGDVFGLQDQVTSNIVTVLAVQLSTSERNRKVTKEAVSTDAYDAFLRGWNEYLKQTPNSYVEAIAHFERASAIDPSYSRAYAALAATYWQSWKRFWHGKIGQRRWHDARVQAEQILSKAMLNPTPLAYQLASAMNLQRGKLDKAAAEAERSIAMDPNDPEGYIALAGALSHDGDPQQAVLMVERAMRLNPHYPPHYLYELGLAQFVLGLFEPAATTFEKTLALNPEDVWSQRMLLATYGQLGHHDDAVRIREDLSRSGFLGLLTVKSALFWHPFKKPEDQERFAEGLRNAGVPD